MLRLCKYLAVSLAVSVFFRPMVGQASSNELPPKTVDMVLDAGGWSSTADDTNQGERLPADLVRQLVNDHPSDPRSIGLLSLALSVAKWGVDADASLPVDPAGDNWKGPTRVSGKHLMSYTVGGVGLPHLDVGPLAKFIEYILDEHPDIGNATERAQMAKFANSLRSGRKYDQIKNNTTFRKWMLNGLRRKDAQDWVLEYWLNSYWKPAYDASGGDIRLALVVARIWNTSPRLGKCAADRALRADDRVQAALQAYVECPGGRETYKSRRWGWMKRPVVLFDTYAKRPPD